MGMLNILRDIRSWFDEYCLESACESAIAIWRRERPEYIDMIRYWVKTGEFPEDKDLHTLCEIYQEQLRGQDRVTRPKKYDT